MRRGLFVTGICCGLACMLCISAAVLGLPSSGRSVVEAQEAEAAQNASAPKASSQEDAAPPYESPVDFTALQAENPDIYAWLDIPGTDISYPVVQNRRDDTLYLDHDSSGEVSSQGALFTEHVYNALDFSDPATVIYGHRMRNGAMFGQLQQIYSDPDGFTEHSAIVVYLPDRELRYQVFAAIPFPGYHILYHYNFEHRRMYRAFLETVLSTRAIGANFQEDGAPSGEDPLLILSTCLMGNRSNRYLVIAKLSQQAEDTELSDISTMKG